MQNFDLARELAEQSEKDWVFGAASQPGVVSIPPSLRAQYLPAGETQFDQYADFTDCASRSPVNHLEAQLTYHYQNGGMRPENKKWLEDTGFIQNGKVTLSDRYIAILSGTTNQGNSLKAPLEALRTQGFVPKKLLPKEDWMTWADYYKRSDITQALLDIGQESRRRFPINYEQVPRAQIGAVLAREMVGVAGYAWGLPVNGVYLAQPESKGFNHAFLLYDLPAYQAYDNYFDFTDGGVQVVGDFTKTLAPDYVFFAYGYRVYISKESAPKHLFLKSLEYGMYNSEVACLQQGLIDRGYPITHAVSNYFGEETKAALAHFQADNGIKDDGTHFGPQTRAVMNVDPDASPLGAFIMALRTYLGI